MPLFLGLSRGAPLLAALQPLDRPAPDLDRQLYQLCVLALVAHHRLCAGDDYDHEGDQLALPVLDSYGTRSLDGAARKSVEHAFASSRASRLESSGHRSPTTR